MVKVSIEVYATTEQVGVITRPFLGVFCGFRKVPREAFCGSGLVVLPQSRFKKKKQEPEGKNINPWVLTSRMCSC